jgi:glutamate-5-semialdehyde dehydrogenase
MTNPLEDIGRRARAASQILAHAPAAQKNAALKAIGALLKTRAAEILAANAKDIAEAKAKNMPEAQLDRLRLTEARLQAMIDGLNIIHDLPDPVDRLLDNVTRPNGLKIEKRSVPIGAIGIIFESRPNVAIDAAALCLKSGNACILRGGSESWQSVGALIAAVQSGLKEAGLPQDAVQTLPSSDREHVGALLTLNDYVDLIIPRGGKSLIARVQKESRIPVLSHLEGICHTYIDAKADPKQAVAVTLNAKMRRSSVCGATECLLLHKNIAATLGKDVIAALLDAGCEVRAPEELLKLDPRIKRAVAGDYGFEFLAPVIAVACVDDVKAAVDFINTHGSQHTDAIITENRADADYFLRHVGSAIALHNASTQFADGGEFGKGAEIGIATGRLHARGPVGLEELTTYQYRVFGTGQIRPV